MATTPGRLRLCSRTTSARVHSCMVAPSAERGDDFLGEERDGPSHVLERHVARTAEVAHQVVEPELLKHRHLADDPFRVTDDLQLLPAEVGTDAAALQVPALPELEALGRLP